MNRPAGSTVGFSGVSAQVGWILTGEHRPYNRSNGVLGRIVPDAPFGADGRGAWEVAARWSMIDLNDADIRGGRLHDLTLGLNWYLNKYTKMQFNYVRASLDGPAGSDSLANLAVVRAQVDF